MPIIRKTSQKNFVKEYLQDQYSCALPSRIRSSNSPYLVEYSEPVDSRRNRMVTDDSEDYSSDPDNGYSNPQDSMTCSRTASGASMAESELYDLAREPSTNLNSSPVKYASKPSPKPRTSSKKNDTGRKESNVNENNFNSPEKYKQSLDSRKRREPKKVVEIEYEVASEIRPSLEASKCESFETSSKTLEGIGATSNLESLNLPASQDNQPEENHYDEPWDLKVKRLQKEQDSKILRMSKDFSENISKSSNKASVYEDAWDNQTQLKKLDKKLSYVRSVSQTSTDIFHDALETQSSTNPTDQSKNNQRLPNCDTSTLYEDPWDVKNVALDQKIRKMQINASVTYEEPWESKFEKRNSIDQQDSIDGRISSDRAHCLVKPQPIMPVHRSVSEREDKIQPMKRGKSHSIDDRKMMSRGCSIGQRIDPLIPLTGQSWFHGNISRDDAEQMLRVCKEGSYIVRISSDRKSYSLSIKSSKQNIHVQIEEKYHRDGIVSYILGKNGREFSSIPEMIDYYTFHRVPLKGAEHIALLHPVECKWSQNSS